MRTNSTNASAVSPRTTPQGTISHGNWSRSWFASLSTPPQLGLGSATPNPRNASPLWMISARAQKTPACTITALATRGRMCLVMIRALDRPSTLAACTYRSSRTDIVTARTTRARPAEPRAPSSSIGMANEFGKIENTTSRMTRPGSAISSSVTRLTTVSAVPRRYPASMPNVTPSTSQDASAQTTPISAGWAP
jgi:hypothetical protein